MAANFTTGSKIVDFEQFLMPRQGEEVLEYADFLNLTVSSLKDFLALLNVTGKKAGLVARVFGAY